MPRVIFQELGRLNEPCQKKFGSEWCVFGLQKLDWLHANDFKAERLDRLLFRGFVQITKTVPDIHQGTIRLVNKANGFRD